MLFLEVHCCFQISPALPAYRIFIPSLTFSNIVYEAVPHSPEVGR